MNPELEQKIRDLTDKHARETLESYYPPAKKMSKQMTFKQLRIGQEFDFIRGVSNTSFYQRCVKTSERCYTTESGMKCQVGSINVEVGHSFEEKTIDLALKEAI